VARAAAYDAKIDAEYASLGRSGKAEDQLCLALMYKEVDIILTLFFFARFL